jgi:hypothetical protein
MNIYCNLISRDGQILRYAIGSLVNDITGEIEVNIDDLSYKIIKQPENSVLYGGGLIESMLAKHKKEDDQGVFKEKISHEIG